MVNVEILASQMQTYKKFSQIIDGAYSDSSIGPNNSDMLIEGRIAAKHLIFKGAGLGDYKVLNGKTDRALSTTDTTLNAIVDAKPLSARDFSNFNFAILNELFARTNGGTQ